MARGNSVSPDFANLLAFGPPVMGVKSAGAPEDDTNTGAAGGSSPVARLREAKAFSDRGDMASKNKILTELVQAAPGDFKVDQPDVRFPGLTHVPSNFQIHAHPSVAAQVAAKPDTTLIDMLNLNNQIAADEEDRYKLGADAVAAKPKKLPYRDRAEMYAIDKDGNVFGGLYDHGSFGVFGGGIDPGEDPASAAAREFQEESGYAVANPRVLPFAPHAVDWKPPYKSRKQAERAKKYRGSRTYYVLGDLGDKIPNAKIDEVGRTQVRPYSLDEAIALATKEAVTDPVLVEANKKRKAILEHIKAQRQPLAVKSAAWDNAPVTVCVDFDGTLAKKQEPFDPKTVGGPRKKIVDLVRLLRKKGCRIIIWTVRGNKKLVRKWCRENRVPWDYINHNPDQPPDSSGKLYADVYLDDKAVNAEDSDSAVRLVMERVAPLLAARETSDD